MTACNFPGCKLEVATFMCEPHWMVLPLALRQRIRNGFDATQPESHASRVVLREIENWIERELGAKPERDNRGRWARLVRYVRDRDASRGRAAAVDNPAPRAPVQLRLVP